jgi:hypothetical protein
MIVALSSQDHFDLESLRLPPEMVGSFTPRKRPFRHRRGEPFIKGPISYSWLTIACRLPGSGFHVAMLCWFTFHRFRLRHGQRRGKGDMALGLRVSERSVRRGLHAAELAGLLAVEREPGCKLTVAILDLAEPKSGSERRPLYGPIPWSWWHPASQLPGKALHTGAICWLLAGWERLAMFELPVREWSDFGLSRFAISRGLEELEWAGLVCVARSSKRSPVVMIQEVKWPPMGKSERPEGGFPPPVATRINPPQSGSERHQPIDAS